MKQVLYLLIGCLYLGSGVMEGQARQFENNPLLWSPKPGITDGVQLVDTSGVAAGAAHEGGALADSVQVVAVPPVDDLPKSDDLAPVEAPPGPAIDETQVAAETETEAVAETETETETSVPKSVSASTEEAGAQKRTGGVALPETPNEVLQILSFGKIFWALVLLVVAYLFIRLLVRILETFAEKSAQVRITIKSVVPVVRIVLWTLFLVAIIKGVFNPPLETLLALGASVAIAVGLAAQDLLKNVFGGIMLLFDRPFQVGDKIEIGSHYGEVLEIGLRATRLVTPDDSVVSVPNMELMNAAVSNANMGELNCQVVAEIILPLDVDTQKVRKIATEAAQVSKFIYLNKPIVVLFFNEMFERRSYLKMRLKAYVMDIRYEFQFKSDMTEIVVRELLAQKLISKEDLGYDNMGTRAAGSSAIEQ